MDSKQTPIERKEILYIGLTTLFSVALILSNIICAKLISLPFLSHFAIPCGLLVFPLTFLISNIVTELYGTGRAKFTVYLGFAMGLITHGIIQGSIALPAHPDWASGFNPFGLTDSIALQKAYHSAFGLSGIALLSSIAAYAVAQILDIRLYAFIKEITHGRFLWMRNLGSTLTSQLVDTFVFGTLVLFCGLKFDLNSVIDIILVSYALKASITIINLPVFYAVIHFSKKYLKEPLAEESELLAEYS